jgi:hypothetical protein
MKTQPSKLAPTQLQRWRTRNLPRNAALATPIALPCAHVQISSTSQFSFAIFFLRGCASTMSMMAQEISELYVEIQLSFGPPWKAGLSGIQSDESPPKRALTLPWLRQDIMR